MMMHYSIPDYEDPKFSIDDPSGTELELTVLDRSIGWNNRWSLDAGCGYGRLSETICQRSENAILLDYSLTNLTRAREKYYRDGKNRYFILADMAKLPFKEASMDLITSIRVLHHLGPLEPYLSEFDRCLSPGGEVIFSFDNSQNAAVLTSFILNRLLGTSLMGIDFNPLSGDTVLAGNSPKNRRIYFHSYKYILSIASLINKWDQVAQFYGGISDSGHKHGTIISVITRKAERALFDRQIARYLFPNSYLVFRKRGHGDKAIRKNIDDVLACPVCKTDVQINTDTVQCRSGHNFEVRDGLIDFRVGR